MKLLPMDLYYNILRYAKKPLSFVTTGQNVPDDIKDTYYRRNC